jgi:hypothetical protein
MRMPLFGLILILNVAECNGQYSDSTQHHTRLVSTGSYNKTNNSSSYLFTDKLNAGLRKKSVTLDFDNTWVYGEQQKVLTNNDFNSTFNCDVRKLFPHAYYWGLATYATSFSLKINNQYQAGAGFAYDIIDHKSLRLNFSDGLVYDNSDIYINDTIRDRYSTGRNSARLMLRYDTRIFTFNINAMLQNSWQIKNDYLIRTDITLGFKILKWLLFTTTYSYNRFNRTEKENTLFTYGLTIEQYY